LALSATRNSSRVAGSIAASTAEAGRHAVAVRPTCVAIDVLLSSIRKHECAARAQAEMESLKLQPSEVLKTLDAEKAKGAKLAKSRGAESKARRLRAGAFDPANCS
jgi:hypothetical protein